jgi:ketosteroid isomerase-like protein
MPEDAALAAPTGPLEANKALVADFLRVFSQGDVPGVVARMTPDATWWVSGTMKGLSGTYTRDQLEVLLNGVKTVYKQGALLITPSAMTAEGQRVAVEADSFAELLNGRVYRNRYHFLIELAGDKVAKVREYMDTEHAYATFLAP